MNKRARKLKIAQAPLKLDLGCGPSKKEGFHGVDIRDIPGVDTVHDLRKGPWPWDSGSVAEVYSSHFLEHLTAPERVTFFNEMYRVMKIGGTALIVSPHWSNMVAYGDPTHQWPPISEFLAFYLTKLWREGDGTPANQPNAAHTGFTCDFDWVVGVAFDNRVSSWNDERRNFAIAHHMNAARDVHFTLTKNR